MMTGLKSKGERVFEVLILLFILGTMGSVAYGIYGPQDSRYVAVPLLLSFLALTLLSLLIKGSLNPLMASLGIRNLIRHKGDSLIAIIGFMVGTSIITSSLVIGDTMTNLVETLIYENYHNVDEVIYIRESSGNRTIIDGESAMEIESRILSIRNSDDLIDGISFEMDLEASLNNPRTGLVEPVVTIRSFSHETTGAFGNIRSNGRSLSPPGDGQLYMTEESADLVNAAIGDTLKISLGGITLNLTLTGIVDQDGRAQLFGGENLYVSFETAYELLNISDPSTSREVGPGNWRGGYYNTVYVSNKGDRVEGGELCDKVVPRINDNLKNLEIPPGSGREPGVIVDKDTGVDRAMEGIDTFIKLFVTLAAFSIIAGITLIINIFVMLSEERREEMGISRAIGLRRSHLRATYLFEGASYSFLSSLIGVLTGVGAALGIILILEELITSFSDVEMDILPYFSIVPKTLVISFSAGFSITLATTWFVTRRIANLNIVSAIKSIPPPKVHTAPQKFIQKLSRSCFERGTGFLCLLAKILDFLLDRKMVWGIISSLAGFFLISWGVIIANTTPAQVGITLLILGFALAATRYLPDRIVYTISSILVLLQWSIENPLFNEYDTGLEIFLFLGLFMVTAGVILIIWNTDIILFMITNLFRLFGVTDAPIKMAISYPMKKRFRTGITVFMFALIIFTVTGTSMFVHIFNINISEFERSVGGGYDIIGISNSREIPDLRGTLIREWGEENTSLLDWEHSTSLAIGYVAINLSLPFNNNLEIPYRVVGVTEEFKSSNTYGFNDVDWDLLRERGISGRRDVDVWSILREEDLIIVDSTLGENQFGPPGLGRKAGDVLTIELDNGTSVRKRIAAITDQFAITGIFTNLDLSGKVYNTTLRNLHMIRVREGGDIDSISDGLRRSLISYGFITIEVREFVREILSFQNSFFDLFNTYLSLGLIIGIVGLGIVTLRSVYERRHEIGMMRAIGFKRRAVLVSFLGEATFIASSGIAVGSAIGIVMGWNLWRDEASSDLPIFGIPWTRILLMGGIALGFALVSCIPPSRMATKVAPAEALRYE
jgi:putative ABC transport system permease protein